MRPPCRMRSRTSREMTRLAAPHLPSPERSKAGPMPGQDRFWFDDGQRRAPVAQETGETDPQEAITSGVLQRASEARRFGGAGPNSRAPRQHAKVGSKARSQGVS